MKKLTFFLILLVAFTAPLPIQAQNINWVALQSDITAPATPGQPIQLTLNGSLNTSIAGAALVLSYDPACFKITGHQPGSLMPGATAFVQEKPGQLDLTYYFLGSGQGLTGEGSLITIHLETVKLCTSDLSTTPENVTLGVLDDKGMAFNLPGVEYRTLSVHLAPGDGQAVIPPQPIAKAPAISSSGAANSQPQAKNAVNNYSILLFVSILAGMGGIVGYFLLRRLSKGNPYPSSLKTASATPTAPALIHDGHPVPLPQKGTQLGRHTEIVKRDGGFYLADTGSQKGTFLNGNRLGTGFYLLRDGDQIQLGREVSYCFAETHKRTL